MSTPKQIEIGKIPSLEILTNSPRCEACYFGKCGCGCSLYDCTSYPHRLGARVVIIPNKPKKAKEKK